VPRRQGVVYGPTLGRDDEPRSGFLSRLLGAAVVLGALVLMGVATFAFLGRVQPGPAGVSPSPTGVAVVSPSPEPASPSPIGPSPTPLPLPTAAQATPSPEPEATPLEIEVREGAGYVTFGSGWTRGSLQMQDVSATFTPGGRLAWSAVLSEPAGAPALDVELVRIDVAEGTEEVTWEETYEMQNQQSERILRRLPINRLTDGPGIYRMRYLRDGEVLSEGYFELVDE
jgi:hypothetical protein